MAINVSMSLEEAESMLTMYKNAMAAVAKNQSYSIGNRSYSRANLATLQQQLVYWERAVTNLSNQANGGEGGSIRPRRVIFRDD